MLASCVEMRKQIRLSHNRSGFAVGEDELDLVGLQQRVEGSGPGADLEASEIEDQVFSAVREQQTHAVTRSDSQPEQRRRRPIHFVVELAIRKHAIAGLQQQEIFIGRSFDSRLEQLANVCGRGEHASILAKAMATGKRVDSL